MKQTIAAIIAIAILFSSCVSSTTLDTIPSGAKVYADGRYIGVTPTLYSDYKISGSSTLLVFKKEGYKDLETLMFREENIEIGAVIGTLFFYLPILWVLGYDDHHLYRLHEDPEFKRKQEEKEEEEKKEEEKKEEPIIEKQVAPVKDTTQKIEADTTKPKTEEPPKKKEEEKKEGDGLPDEEDL